MVESQGIEEEKAPCGYVWMGQRGPIEAEQKRHCEYGRLHGAGFHGKETLDTIAELGKAVV